MNPLLTDSEKIDRLQKALAKATKLASLVTVRQVIEAGDEYIDAAGLNPWCMAEGLADGSEKIGMHNLRLNYNLGFEE